MAAPPADPLQEAAKYKERLSIALKAAKICVFEVELLSQRYVFFENAEDIFGVSGYTILQDVAPYSKLSPSAYQKAVADYFSHPEDAEIIDNAFQCIFRGQPTTYQARMRAGGSSFVWCKIDVTPIMENGRPVRMIGVITDITSLKAKTDKLENAVRLDSFTGLYNKKYSLELIRKGLNKNPKQNQALLLLDIDNFKFFNDTYGHSAGDNIIQLVAGELKQCFRKTEVIGRFGGDEFVVFIPHVPSRQWLFHKLQALVRLEDGPWSCTNSIGIALCPQDGVDFDLLFEKADNALYRSKAKKESYTLFSS